MAEQSDAGSAALTAGPKAGQRVDWMVGWWGDRTAGRRVEQSAASTAETMAVQTAGRTVEKRAERSAGTTEHESVVKLAELSACWKAEKTVERTAASSAAVKGVPSAEMWDGGWAVQLVGRLAVRLVASWAAQLADQTAGSKAAK